MIFFKTPYKKMALIYSNSNKGCKKIKKNCCSSESSRKDVVKDFSLKDASIEVVHNGIDLVSFILLKSLMRITKYYP